MKTDDNNESYKLKYPEPDYCLVCGGIQFGIHYHDLTEGDDDDGMDD